jgi:hypothetical protein
MTNARLYDAAITLVYVGRSSGLAVNPMIVYTPLVIPAPPTLVRVRPKISAVGLGETLQMRLPEFKNEN